MPGTRPGIFPSLSLFPQVSRWGSRAPSCFDLCVEFFSQRTKKMKTNFPIEYLLFSFPHLVLWRCLETERKNIIFFLPHQRGLLFFLKRVAGNTSSLRATGLRSAHLHIRMNQEQFQRGHQQCPGRQLPLPDVGSALPSQTLPQDQPGPTPRARSQNGCKWMQGKENINLYQLSLWNKHKSAGTQMLEGGIRGQRQHQQETLPTKVCDTGQDKREPGQHILFCYLLSHTLMSNV